MGWLVPFFPAGLAFVALGSGFPESDGFRARVEAMIAAREGPLYVMLRHPQDANRAALDQAGAVLARYGMRLEEGGCAPFEAWIGKRRSSIQLCTVRRAALRTGSG